MSNQGKKWAVQSYGPVANLQQMDFPLPTAENLPPKDVLVKIHTTDATYTDMLIIRGNYRPLPPCPCTPGYTCVGTVMMVGSAVSSVRVGDRIASMPQAHCYATHVVLPEHLVIKISPTVDPVKAVSVVLTGSTAYQMLHRAGGGRLTPTSRILVHACGGGTGAMIVTLAKIAGLSVNNIYGTCSEKSMAVVGKLGIKAFNYKTDDWRARVMESTHGEGVDLVFDSVFLGSYFAHGVSCLKSGGKYIAYGLTNVADAGGLHIPSVILQFMRLGFQHNVLSWFDRKQAAFFTIADERDAHPDLFRADLAVLLDLVATGDLDPVIGRVWTFDQAKEALQSIENNVHTAKQVIVVSTPTP